MIQKKKSLSHNQHKLKILSDRICDRIDDLLSYFDLEYRMTGKFISMSCPIHGGDNISAFNLYPDGEKYRGNWKCRSHGCEEVFRSSILGFIRGVLSHQDYGWSKNGDKLYSFDEAIQFAEKFLNQRVSDIKVDKTHIEKNNFSNTVSFISTNESTTNTNVTQIKRQQIRKSLSIPSKYFLSRGFSAEILDKYDVGDCINSGKEMNNRAVVPVYDTDNKFMTGCSGRSIHNKCDKCNHYHSSECPSESELYKYSKWRHSLNFKSQNNLYNFWFAKDFIKDSKKAIIVESPGNVWKLEEAGIHNSVAIFGTNLSNYQKMLLDTSGAMTLIIAMDNDEPGRKAAESIFQKCHKIYNIHKLSISNNDIGEMTVNKIKNEILPQINNLI
jgi:5S rRNA maturation endonuclease (ribonuclease M5)